MPMCLFLVLFMVTIHCSVSFSIFSHLYYITLLLCPWHWWLLCTKDYWVKTKTKMPNRKTKYFSVRETRCGNGLAFKLCSCSFCCFNIRPSMIVSCFELVSAFGNDQHLGNWWLQLLFFCIYINFNDPFLLKNLCFCC